MGLKQGCVGALGPHSSSLSVARPTEAHLPSNMPLAIPLSSDFIFPCFKSTF